MNWKSILNKEPEFNRKFIFFYPDHAIGQFTFFGQRILIENEDNKEDLIFASSHYGCASQANADETFALTTLKRLYPEGLWDYMEDS